MSTSAVAPTVVVFSGQVLGSSEFVVRIFRTHLFITSHPLLLVLDCALLASRVAMSNIPTSVLPEDSACLALIHIRWLF